MISYRQPSLILSPCNTVLSAVTNVLIVPSQSIHRLVYANYFESTFCPLLASDHFYLLALISLEKLRGKISFSSQPLVPPPLDPSKGVYKQNKQADTWSLISHHYFDLELLFTYLCLLPILLIFNLLKPSVLLLLSLTQKADISSAHLTQYEYYHPKQSLIFFS